MMNIAKWLATCLGIGYIQKGAGTVAALFCCAVWYWLKVYEANFSEQIIQITLLFFIGVWSAARVEKTWGHDSNRIVIDEWLGMSVALFLIPFKWPYVICAFILFRFFDILKPLFIRRAEAAPSGWGVMLDDLLAGIYSNVILHLLIKSNLF
jgi:phosphatidylglycerophosphatase A